MSVPPDDIVILGLSISSSWGNGHATTFRALVRGLGEMGKRVLFLERDVPWYAAHRDLSDPDYCELHLYKSLQELRDIYRCRIANAAAVVVGSYVPDGGDVLDLVLETARGVRAFYDIDTPVTLAALNNGSCAYLQARQIPALDLYLSFTGGPTLDYLAHQYGARRPLAFYCSVDDRFYHPEPAAQRWDLGYLGTYSPDRQPALERLLLVPAQRLPSHRFVVAGPQYPADIIWPDNVDHIDHVPPSQHPSFYAAQRFTLNVTRADMIAAGWSPSVRLFEAAACGTPIISDRWDGLTDLLPDKEAIVVADETDAVVSALTSMDEPARRRLAERARAIVLSGHTGRARASQLGKYLLSAASTAAELRQ